MSEDNKLVTQEYITEKIEQILNNQEHITKALDEIRNIPESKGPGDMSPGAKADAIAQIVSKREETNQELIKLLNNMYDNSKEIIINKQVSRLIRFADDEELYNRAKEALDYLK